MKITVFILSIITVLMISQRIFSQDNPFVPADFEVPDTLENEHFRMRMLTVNDVVKDYDAVMTSLDHLQVMFLPLWNWPTEDLTFEQDLIDLGWHQKEFQMRRSFAYTVVCLDETEVLGCVYIDPSNKAAFDAEIYMWVRQSEVENGLDSILFDTVKNWIDDRWPFENPAYPLREISLEEWKSIN
jgi:hypothetical protein